MKIIIYMVHNLGYSLKVKKVDNYTVSMIWQELNISENSQKLYCVILVVFGSIFVATGERIDTHKKDHAPPIYDFFYHIKKQYTIW